MRQPVSAESSREILCRNRRTALKRVYVPLLNGSERHLALERRFVDRLHRVAASASARAAQIRDRARAHLARRDRAIVPLLLAARA